MPAKTLRLSEAEWEKLRKVLKQQSVSNGELSGTYNSDWRNLARKVAYQAASEPLHPDEARKLPTMDAPPPAPPAAQPHAVRQNDLVEALRAVAERFPGHTELNHALRLLAQKLAEL